MKLKLFSLLMLTFSLSFGQQKLSISKEGGEPNQRLTVATQSNQLAQTATSPKTDDNENASPFDAVRGLKEDTSKRDAFSKHYVNEDGSFTALIGAGPIHYQKNGQFLDIDHKITQSSVMNYPFANTTNLMESYFGATVSKGVKSKTAEGEVLEFMNPTMYWEVNGQKVNVMEAANSQAQIQDDKAVYPNVYGNIGVEYQVLTGKREMNYVIPNLESLGEIPNTGGQQVDYLVFTEDIVLPFGWTSTITERGILIKDQLGQEMYMYENPHSTDAQSMGLREENTVFAIQHIGNTLKIATKVKADWLLSNERVYPVMVDPTTNYSANGGRSVYSDGDVETTGFFGYVANSWWIQYHIRFNTSAIPTGSLVSATTGYIYKWGNGGTYKGTPQWHWSMSADPVTTTNNVTLYNSASSSLSSSNGSIPSGASWLSLSFANGGPLQYVENGINGTGYVSATVRPTGAYGVANVSTYFAARTHNDTDKPYLKITYTVPNNCSGTPAGGTTVLTPNTGTHGESFTGTVSGSTSASGLTYQWQSAPSASGPWTDISGATGASYDGQAPYENGTIYFRRKITCTYSGGVAYSTAVPFTVSCTPQHSSGNCASPGDCQYIGISNVTIGDINNSTGYANNPPAYNYYSNLSTDVEIGETYELKVTYKDNGGNLGEIAVWVDWNEDGDFSDANEFIGIKTNVANNSVQTFNITVPAGVSPGTKRLRVRSAFNGEGFTNMDACTIMQYGETEDYNLEVIDSSGKPNNITFHNYGGAEQLAFNNSRIDTNSPTFRLSHESYDANAYEISIANNINFTGEKTQTFNGTYTVDTETNFNFTNTSFVPSNNTTYYVKARVKGDAETWSAWTTETYSFTYQSPKELPGWFQTENAQFETDALSGTTTSNHDVIVSAGGANRVTNGDFENGLTGWTKTGDNGAGKTVAIYNNAHANYPGNWLGMGTGSQVFQAATGTIVVAQEVDLTDIDEISFKAGAYHYVSCCTDPDPNTKLEFKIGGTLTNTAGTVAATVTQGSNNRQDKTVSTTSYTGVQVIKFVMTYVSNWNGNGMARYYIDDVTAEAPPISTITSTPIHFASVQDAEGYDELIWNQTLGGGTLDLKVQGSSNGTNWSDISSHTGISESGDGEFTYDISSIDHQQYPHIRLVGTLDGAAVKLHDWAVEFKKDEVEDCEVTTTYTSSGWSNGFPTDSPKMKVVIEQDYTVDGSFGDIIACSLEVRNGAKLTVTDGYNLFVDEEVVVDNASGSELTIKDGANLFQVNDAAINIGKIKVEKQFVFSEERKQYNFVSVPVEDFLLKGGVSNDALYDGMTYVLKYNEATDYFVNASDADHITGKGFAIKEASVGKAIDGLGVFTGVPNNGVVSIDLVKTGQGFNLIGNPYPSTLDLKTFYTENQSALGENEGATFWFWDNRGNELFEQLGPAYADYATNHYASFNAAHPVNGTGTPAPDATGNAKEPTRYLKSGTGFMVKAKSATTVTFNNAQRGQGAGPSFTGKTVQANQETDGANDGFGRYWLKLKTPKSLVISSAIAYFEGGDNGYAKDDSDAFGSSDELYFTLADKKLIIQGKAPFVDTDVVPMGYKAFDRGTYSIELGKIEGVFEAGQKIYLKDKQMNVTHDFSQGAYEFKSNAGEFNNRFEIVYKKGMKASGDVLQKNQIAVQKVNHEIEVTSTLDKIVEVEIYNLSGRSIMKARKINDHIWSVPAARYDKQILFVVVKTETGEIVTKKLVNK